MREAAQRSFENALATAGIAPDEIERTGGTGWGERYIPFAHTTESMISCLAGGANWMVAGARTVVDMGGLSSTIVNIDPDREGKVIEYRRNDRCASGTGFFLEMAAHALEFNVEDLGRVAMAAEGRVHISAQCAVFGESEIVTHVNDGADPAHIVAGITYAIGASMVSMANRLSLEKEIVLTGGVAKNAGVVSAFEEKTGAGTGKTTCDPQLAGAVGAALQAARKVEA
jgi:predicted CoA-substrate-specific enzyme activase